MLENTEQPLVSIIVITYNSSKFVLETLESTKAQTYRNIELIVSDDNSSDETVEICKKWIDENKYRFVRATLVSARSNTGIPANINRGVNTSQGSWIKCIAGDDLLAKDCITELIYYTSTQEKDIQILFSDVVRFYGNSINNVEIKKNQHTFFRSGESTANEQYEMLLRINMVSAASVIIRKDLLLSVNGFDERFKLLEDWPLWVKITSAGYKIHYLDKPLVFYRIHENNLSMTTDKNYICHPVSKINISFKEKELIHRLPFIERLGLKHDILAIKTCFFLGNNKKNIFTRFIYLVFNISNPFYNYLRIRKILGIKYRNYKAYLF
jgi:glycosyltransferase involved in cell wall biosynthesis